jgi:hypothetical protein
MKFNEIEPVIKEFITSIENWFVEAHCRVFTCDIYQYKDAGDLEIIDGILYFIIIAAIIGLCICFFLWYLSSLLYTVVSIIGLLTRLFCSIFKFLPFAKHRYFTSFQPLYHYLTWSIDHTIYNKGWSEEEIKEYKNKQLENKIYAFIGSILITGFLILCIYAYT